jgi:hypothetical protein
MNYDQFRTLFHEALETAGLAHVPFRPIETVELDGIGRTYEITVTPGGAQRAGPFHVTATLGWRWGAALAARSVTSEEDLLTEILGRDGYYLVTEQPWLRVDVTLNATLPWDAPLPLPGANAWSRWMVKVTARVLPILPTESDEDEYERRVLSSCGEPEARLRCSPAGHLFLAGVHLPAWQGIDLPRQWDNSDREPDPWPDEQLAGFMDRVREALEEWEGCLKYLPKTAEVHYRIQPIHRVIGHFL